MLHLSISPEDAEVLREVLEAARMDLSREIWHTDAREFRSALHDREKALERLLAELRQESKESSAEATPYNWPP